MAGNRRAALQQALANAQAAGDTAAVTRLQEALNAMPPPMPGDALRAVALPQRSASEALLGRPPPGAAPAPSGMVPAEPTAPTAELGDLSMRELAELKQYEQHATALSKVGYAIADYSALLQKIDAEKAQPPDKHRMNEHQIFSHPPDRADIPGAGGMANAVGGALEDVKNAPLVGNVVGVLTSPLGHALRNTTDAGREVRQRSKELELLGANALVKGTGQISDYERKMVKDAWGLDPTDLYADRNIRIGIKKAAADMSKQMDDLEKTYPGAAAYMQQRGVSSADLRKRLAEMYDPTAVLNEENK